jgi:hypothetical protein
MGAFVNLTSIGATIFFHYVFLFFDQFSVLSIMYAAERTCVSFFTFEGQMEDFFTFEGQMKDKET